MNTLYPIIRRKRRLLIVADKPPFVEGSVEPVQAVATMPAETVPTDSIPQTGDGQASPTPES